MADNCAVKGECIYKTYKLYEKESDKVFDFIFGKRSAVEFHALRNVTFEVPYGECVGLIGLNGSGKSTLADIVAGISQPTAGFVELNGEPALIAIGVGLNVRLTGLENIEYKGILTGLSMRDIDQLKEEIIEFADIGPFISQPVKTYSSGMRSRLGFAISVCINPDILIIDEALSVGDPTFVKKCLDKIKKFRTDGKTIFLVSHNMPQIKDFCTKAMWLEYGVLKAYGDVGDVLPEYEGFLSAYNKMTKNEKLVYESEKKGRYNTVDEKKVRKK